MRTILLLLALLSVPLTASAQGLYVHRDIFYIDGDRKDGTNFYAEIPGGETEVWGLNNQDQSGQVTDRIGAWKFHRFPLWVNDNYTSVRSGGLWEFDVLPGYTAKMLWTPSAGRIVMESMLLNGEPLNHNNWTDREHIIGIYHLDGLQPGRYVLEYEFEPDLPVPYELTYRVEGNITAVEVPEPSGLALALVGVVGLVAWRSNFLGSKPAHSAMQ